MPTSFLSEHSAEFVLVPALAQIFSSRGCDLVPLYFWKTREGSSVSRRCEPAMPVQVFAMYARRPKVVVPGQDHILVKFNDLLFQRAGYLRDNGIPTIAGVPLVSSIMDFRIVCLCSWFSLSPAGPSQSDFECVIDIKSNQCNTALPSSLQGPWNDEEILRFVSAEARPMLWQKAIEVLRGNAFDQQYAHRFYWRWPTYKPVYLVMLDR